MAVVKIDCPECGATLKPAKPLTPGKKVRCPKCDNVFVVPGAEDEEEQEAPARKAKTAAGKASRKPAPAEEPAPPPPAKAVEDEDEGGIYGVIQQPGEEKEEEDRKPKVEYAPDLSVKNPRGPATAAVAVPSNGILGFGALLALLSVGTLCVDLWPFLFTKWSSGVLPSEAKKKYEKEHRKSGSQERQSGRRQEQTSFVDEDQVMLELQRDPDKLAKWEDMVEDDRITRIIVACCCVAALIYFVVMAYAGVQLQNLESVRWSWTACIMAMICIAGFPLGAWGYLSNEDNSTFTAFGTFLLGVITGATFPFGLWSLFLLKKPAIVEAFTYEVE
ncbi:MAG: hypothetical protein HYS12_05860 [Planctomycetes bacterium]|nr:hypothetical protein [Planctomycetota bacterium]